MALSNSAHFLLLVAVTLVAWAYFVHTHELSLPASGESSPANADAEQDLPAVWKKQEALFVTAGVCAAFAAFMMLPSLCTGPITSANAGQWGGFLACAAATLVIFSWFYHANGQKVANVENYNPKTTATLRAVGGSAAGLAALLGGMSALPMLRGLAPIAA